MAQVVSYLRGCKVESDKKMMEEIQTKENDFFDEFAYMYPIGF